MKPPSTHVTRRIALAALLILNVGGAYAQPSLAVSPPSQPSALVSSPDAAQAIALPELATALRSGGYVIYFRHAATDFSKNDASMTRYADCSTQRMLSAQGRTDARDMGKRIAALKLPIGQALASPMCRTMESAQLILGRATAQNDIREGALGDYPGLKRLLTSPVANGTNRWIVGHGSPFRTVAGAPHLAEGEAAVLRPGGTQWTVVARVLPQDWAQLK